MTWQAEQQAWKAMLTDRFGKFVVFEVFSFLICCANRPFSESSAFIFFSSNGFLKYETESWLLMEKDVGLPNLMFASFWFVCSFLPCSLVYDLEMLYISKGNPFSAIFQYSWGWNNNWFFLLLEIQILWEIFYDIFVSEVLVSGIAGALAVVFFFSPFQTNSFHVREESFSFLGMNLINTN